MSLAAAGITEGQYIFLVIQKRSFKEMIYQGINLQWETTSVEDLQAFFKREVCFPALAWCTFFSPFFTFSSYHLHDVLFNAQRLPAGKLCLIPVTLSEGRKMKLFKVAGKCTVYISHAITCAPSKRLS